MSHDGTRSSRALRATSSNSTFASRGRQRRCSSLSDRHREVLEMTDEETRGMQVRREVLGDEYVDRAEASRTPLTDEFQDLITRYAWGEIWTRPSLDRRTRSCITVGLLVALNRDEELALHIRAALRNGVTADELKEILRSEEHTSELQSLA